MTPDERQWLVRFWRGVRWPAAPQGPEPNRCPVLNVPLLGAIAVAAMLTACSNGSSEPTSQPAQGSASTTVQTNPGGGSARADITVDGHTHRISGRVDCTTQAADPSATPPRGNLAIDASDAAASFSLSLSVPLSLGSASPLWGLSLSYKVDNGEYAMPYYPNPPNVTVTGHDKSYTAKGTPPVRAPDASRTTDLPVEIHVTCP